MVSRDSIEAVTTNLRQNGSSIICDSNITIRGNQNLIETAGTLERQLDTVRMPQRPSYQRSLDDVGNGLGRDNVRLNGLGAVLSLFLALAEQESLSAASQYHS